MLDRKRRSTDSTESGLDVAERACVGLIGLGGVVAESRVHRIGKVFKGDLALGHQFAKLRFRDVRVFTGGMVVFDHRGGRVDTSRSQSVEVVAHEATLTSDLGEDAGDILV